MDLAGLADGLLLSEELARIPVSGLTEDSRAVKTGMLFAALPGTKTDGSVYARQAAEQGAAVILAGPDAQLQDLAAPVLRVANPRAVFAHMAGRFYGKQPDIIAAITGTNGKTSVASFLRQIWRHAGFQAASLGTVGVVSPAGERFLSHTTPDTVTLHKLLAGLVSEGVTHLALEASSHGLAQHRLDGVSLSACAFTNLTRDHLDYHDSFEAYLQAKLRLFAELAPSDAPAVIDADAPGAEAFIYAANARGLRALTIGRNGSAIQCRGAERSGYGQQLDLMIDGARHGAHLPLAGDFQVSNALAAAALALSTGCETGIVLEALAQLKGAKGRLEYAGQKPSGAPVFIDYAHTPDALAKALQALRPYVAERLIVVFGCGGDRDPGKRPQMGAAAAAYAELIIVTDDNPRSEDPAAIRKAIRDAAPGAVEIASRGEAIAEAIHLLKKGDLLLIAGKGHETGQIIGGTVLPFSDHEEVAKALYEQHSGAGRPLMVEKLWTIEEAARAMDAVAEGTEAGAPISGISIDSRTLAAADLFFAIKGEHSDGHAYANSALQKGAAAAVVSHNFALPDMRGPLLRTGDTLNALNTLACAARARTQARVAAVTGSAGKTGTKEMLRLMLGAQGAVHASEKSYNNHWGVPLSLARMPASTEFGVFELGMNHAGEIAPLSRMVRPHIAIVTTVAPVHIAFFETEEQIADAKAEIFTGLEPDGVAILPQENRHYARLAAHAAAENAKAVPFGRGPDAAARLTKFEAMDAGSDCEAVIMGEHVRFRLSAPGAHLAMNAVAALAAVKLAGADLRIAAEALAQFEAPEGRGRRHRVELDGGVLEIIDESYNANPASMRAALAVLASAKGPHIRRRIAVLGDMLELGHGSAEYHAQLAEAIDFDAIDLVFCAGPHMAHLYNAIPASKRGGYAADSEGLSRQLSAAVSPGDVVMIKGSLGSRMGSLAEVLKTHSGAKADKPRESAA